MHKDTGMCYSNDIIVLIYVLFLEKGMRLPPGFCSILALCSCVPLSLSGALVQQDTTPYKQGHVLLSRNKRVSSIPGLLSAAAAVWKGKSALTKLLNNAEKVEPSDNLFKRYQKTGGMKEMTSDFFSVHPKHIHTMNNARGTTIGHVGDRTVVMELSPITGKPTILIVKQKSNKKVVDQIVYTN